MIKILFFSIFACFSISASDLMTVNIPESDDKQLEMLLHTYGSTFPQDTVDNIKQQIIECATSKHDLHSEDALMYVHYQLFLKELENEFNQISSDTQKRQQFIEKIQKYGKGLSGLKCMIVGENSFY